MPTEQAGYKRDQAWGGAGLGEAASHLQAKGRVVGERVTIHASMLHEMAKTVEVLAETARATRGSVEALYLSPTDRLRVAASLTGIGMAALGLVAGAPAYTIAPRLVNNLVSLARTGRIVRATAASVPLRLALEEILG